MSIEKIYSDDPLLRYKDTEITAFRTKAQIDGILAEWGITDVWWHWEKDLVEKNEPAEIWVKFTIEEIVDGLLLKVGVRVDCPTIWDRAKPKGRPARLEQVNWNVSFRAMHWFIYTHLNTAYAMRSSKIVAFLPFIQGSHGKSLKDLVLPRLSEYQALESRPIKEGAQ